MYVLIDNYDSFTYNLYQHLLEVSGREVKVFRNDRVTLEDLERMNPEGIVISPGPGRPEEAGVSVPLVRRFTGRVPILGVCLGHQAIGCAFGGSVRRAKRIVHGKTDDVAHDGKGLFRNVPSPSRFTRYHSLAVGREDLPTELEITATSADGEIMGLRHRIHSVEGIQFHPESIASEHGKKILKNFVHYRRSPFNISSGLAKLSAGGGLTAEEAACFMDDLTEGELTDSQIAAYLIALSSGRTRPGTGAGASARPSAGVPAGAPAEAFAGVSPSALAAMASVLLGKKKGFLFDKPLLDTCGTGGDGKGTFNVSSLSAIVASACGACVAKHGNRGASSPSGSADFYGELGIPVGLEPGPARTLLERTGFTFLFAPLYHDSMKHAARARRELGIKTVMNLLGPLVNPADASFQLVGVYAGELVRPLAESLGLLGKTRAMVVHGLDGTDEISLCAPTKVAELRRGAGGSTEIVEYTLDPRELGVPLVDQSALRGGGAKENALAALRILGGSVSAREHGFDPGAGPSGGRASDPGADAAVADAVCLNAGAALYLYGLSGTVGEGYALARKAVESGAAREKLKTIVEEGKRISAQGAASGADAAREGGVR